MYLGEDRETRRARRGDRPSVQNVMAERRAERGADRLEREEARARRMVQRATPSLPAIPTTPSAGSPVVTGTVPGEGDASDAPQSAQGGSATTSVNIAPGDPASGGMGILPIVAIGAALFFLF